MNRLSVGAIDQNTNATEDLENPSVGFEMVNDEGNIPNEPVSEKWNDFMNEPTTKWN